MVHNQINYYACDLLLCIMSQEPNKAIITLKLIRDVLIEFDHLIENLTKSERKYGLSTKDTAGLNLGSTELLQTLTKSLSLEQLGLLFVVVSDITILGDDFKNFMSMTTEQKEKFHERLGQVIENLDKALKGV